VFISEGVRKSTDVSKAIAVRKQMAPKLQKNRRVRLSPIMRCSLVARDILRPRSVSAYRPAVEDDTKLVSFNRTNCFSYNVSLYKF